MLAIMWGPRWWVKVDGTHAQSLARWVLSVAAGAYLVNHLWGEW
jgi:hypothetical protein